MSYLRCSEYGDLRMTEILSAMEREFSREGYRHEVITDRKRQRFLGDVRLHKPGQPDIYVDVKSERHARPTAFIEVFSNNTTGERCRPGWLFTMASDRIWYHMQESRTLAILDLPALRNWMLTPDQEVGTRYMRYPVKKQTAHEQMNVTEGRPVPFLDMPRHVFRRAYLLDGGLAIPCRRDAMLARIARVAAARGPLRATRLPAPTPIASRTRMLTTTATGGKPAPGKSGGNRAQGHREP